MIERPVGIVLSINSDSKLMGYDIEDCYSMLTISSKNPDAATGAMLDEHHIGGMSVQVANEDNPTGENLGFNIYIGRLDMGNANDLPEEGNLAFQVNIRETLQKISSA